MDCYLWLSSGKLDFSCIKKLTIRFSDNCSDIGEF